MKFQDMSEDKVLALCLYGEARGEGIDGLLAVAQVVINRSNNDVRWDGVDIKSTCLKDKQFSCFNEGTESRAVLQGIADSWDASFKRSKILWRCWWVAKGVIDGVIDGEKLVRDATHYHRVDITPKWITSPNMRLRTTIGDHIFYREVT